MELPRVDSRTPLQASNLGDSDYSKHQMTFVTHPTVAAFVSVFQPRKPKQRTTLLALFLLVCLTTYIFIANSASLFPSTFGNNTVNSLSLALETIKNSHFVDNKPPPSHKKSAPFKLDPHQELAAVSSFIASLPQNVVPNSVDPKVPIDPQLVLDFDTSSPRAQDELKALIQDVWSRNPVFLYAKHFSSASREVKALLLDLNLKPEPTIIEVDTREDAQILIPMLARLTSVQELPVLLVGGQVVGSTEKIHSLYKSGELQKLVTEAGARVIANIAKKKKKHMHKQ